GGRHSGGVGIRREGVGDHQTLRRSIPLGGGGRWRGLGGRHRGHRSGAPTAVVTMLTAVAARAGGKQARARAARDRARSILLVAGTAEELVAQEPLVARLRQLGHQVRWAYAEGRLPTRWSRAVQTQVPAPRRLVAARTPSRPHRAVLTLAPRVLDQRRRLTLAARFDPWFRTAARGADDVVLLGSGEAVRPVLAALELTPRVHTDAQGLAALTDRLWID